MRTAFSSSSNGITGNTGPKISSRLIFNSFVASAKIVGSINRPLRSILRTPPPATSLAADCLPESTYRKTLSYSAFDAIGPTCVAGSRGSPKTAFAAFLANRSTISS